MSEAKFKFGDRVQDGKYGMGLVGAYSPESRLPYLVCFECGKLMWTTGADINRVASTPPPNTVPVRIAVAVTADGRTESRQIRDGDNEDEIRQIVAEDLLGGVPGFCRVSAITAHVPLPEQPAEVEGVVDA